MLVSRALLLAAAVRMVALLPASVKVDSVQLDLSQELHEAELRLDQA